MTACRAYVFLGLVALLLVSLGASAEPSSQDRPARALLPATPVQINLLLEGGRYLFRTHDAMAIYVYARDPVGQSVCTGRCAQTWPPVYVSGEYRELGEWTVIERADGSLQWAYKGQPLYTYANDDPGTIRGDGLDGLWAIATP